MSSDRDRQRLRRQRAARGARIALVEVTPAREEALLQAGVLAEWDSDARVELGHAIERLLDLLHLEARHA